ncbi:MAG: PIN domain-containing protein [Burkholderiaceae bacterium]
MTTTPTPHIVVLDTNVVLDWLLFRDARSAKLQAALRAGSLDWIATPAMRAELAHVLDRGRLDAWPCGGLWEQWDRHCRKVPATPCPMAAAANLRCTDPDDQKFIDLAVASRARWLLTRDRAVLKLARPLRFLGVGVLTPDRWTFDQEDG